MPKPKTLITLDINSYDLTTLWNFITWPNELAELDINDYPPILKQLQKHLEQCINKQSPPPFKFKS